ncbi:MAG TPA: magnesium transporter [Burkholderiales bacterium]
MGFDRAVASAPFVATLVDLVGLVIYFSVNYSYAAHCSKLDPAAA